ncbi:MULTISPECIES: hypothetical protein [unclassified Tolypothrix]|nr:MULTISPECIES: hypothetical protein [unclassified Tolypothrix]BAY93767.1 hypothetical protein NIES3275_58090 [Microchaete diplosiphon NIES-3275]EKF03316.1 hypothetical protein FDUTEX481_02675 [Tolypothrix sp. PCC 7601]MBE9087260.1 hypothetical protein [Tolypothrix sp. LEGE 11397]UYD27566.1 hypothetical protein HGR01_05690 [Tolypothrix sp. PCC 7712]UYD36573.1 hypothetical protein HG267_13020 [Tolypothrix sp. PCC 7601]
MNVQQQTQQAWDALMGIDKRHYVLTGFYEEEFRSQEPEFSHEFCASGG